MPSDETMPLWPDNPTSEDLLGFSDVASPIVEALKRDRLDPVALGVFGDWGSGKTTVLELVKDQLDDKSIVVVYTRPWEYDPATDPKATLIGEVLIAVRDAAGDAAKGPLKDRFAKLAKRIKWSKAIGLATHSAISLSPPTFEQVTEIFGKDDEGPEEPTLQGFRDEFEELMGKLDSVSRVVVLVDDLDRCLPESVIGALEAIKLFLSVRKMGFVIAADERLVRHAIATRYEGAPKAEEMAQQYLEKIVQIPLRVPSLGQSDTEAYLALLLLRRHFATDQSGFAAIVEHCANQRAKSVSRVLEDLPADAIPDEAREDFSLAPQLAPVLAREGNPRRLKRFMNAYWLRADIARRRKAELEPAALAKLLLLEQLSPDEFRVLLSWLANGELPERLSKLEDAKKQDDLDAEARPLFEWSQVQPALAEKDLGPYLRLAASLRSLPGPRTELRPEMVELLDDLAATDRSTRQSGQGRVAGLPAEDRIALLRELVRKIQAEPARQDEIGESLAALAEDEQVASELADRLRDLDPGSIEPALVIWLKDAQATHPVIKEWASSDQLKGDTKKAADQVLKGD